MARYGKPILMRHYNALPIDPAANRGFGLHTITTHEHNGHNPAESDGYTNAFFFPGQFYDYRWPMQLAGYDTINTDATDPRAAFPCAPGRRSSSTIAAIPGLKTCENGSIKIRGDWRETMSTHWFHDHMLDFTAQNVYKGNAVMMNYYSALDRGNEDFDDGVNLRFPSGTALTWGNRDYDVNLVIADKAWDQHGPALVQHLQHRRLPGRPGADQLAVQALPRRARAPLPLPHPERLGVPLLRDRAGAPGATATAERCRARPGSGVSYNRVPFHMIANDGNIMEHAVPFDGTWISTATAISSITRASSRPRASRSATTSSSTSASTASSPATSCTSSTCSSTRTGRRPASKIPLADDPVRGVQSRRWWTIDNDGMADAGSTATRASASSWNSGFRPTRDRT